MRVRCPLVLGVVVAWLGALLLAPPAGAHSPGLVLRGFGTPTVHGLLGPGEWSGGRHA